MDRKEFFFQLGKSAFDLVKDHHIVKKIEAFTEPKERPPGALADDALFQQMCTGCDACMKACPVNVVMIEDLEKRHPVIYPEKDPCIRCEGFPCITACPTGALSSKENIAHLESSASPSKA